jgi:hypothetical protein
MIHALTSLSPERLDVQRICLDSWKSSGLAVHVFAHSSEAALAEGLGLDVVLVEKTGIDVFGRHYIPVNSMVEWARRERADVLISNSDIELNTTRDRLEKLLSESVGGVCCVRRHDEAGVPYAVGFDGFLFNGRDAEPIAKPSFFCVGRPWWDYWIPTAFLVADRPVCVTGGFALHRRHQFAWGEYWTDSTPFAYDEVWIACAREFERLIGAKPADNLGAFAREKIDAIYSGSRLI